MVEVTKSNFAAVFPCIEEATEKSCFIAIDAEFTGLYLDSENEASLFDSLESRYQKLKSRASTFVPCQIGLSFFIKDEKENKYFVETYVFFIRPYLCGSIDKRFMCQVSCLDFLCKYDFDFNKFIKEGIPYLNKDEEEQIRKEIDEGTIGFSHEKLGEFKPKRELDMLINNLTKSTEGSANEPLLRKQSEKTNRLVMDKPTICHEYFQMSELRRKYPSLWVYSKDNKIVVESVSPKTIKDLQHNSQKEEDSFIDYYLGFTKVFRLITAAKKPTVGHNLLMDLLLFYHNFHKPLPKTYKEFKKELHGLFPIIFDTRHIWLHVKKFYKLKHIPMQSGLFDLYEMFKNPTDSLSTLYSPNVEHTNCDKYRKEEFPHESGYDSYVTGWVFLKICHVLALNKISNPLFIQPQSFKQHLKAVSPFQNKVNIARSNVRYIDLEGDDPTLVESQLLHICVRNKKRMLTYVELCRLFEKYGLVEFKLNRNKREAVLAIGSLRSFREILEDYKKDPDYIVSKYSTFKHSAIVNTTLWLTALGTCTIVAVFSMKFFSRT